MKAHTAYWPVLTLGHGRSESTLSQALRRVWQSLMAHLDVSDEPRVWPSSSGNGEPAWNAYDPITGQSVYLVSEAELRTWLEDLHYQDQRIAKARQADLKLFWSH
ncbi:MAG: hypothetical protein ACHWZW_07965 [Spirulina sp.]